MEQMGNMPTAGSLGKARRVYKGFSVLFLSFKFEIASNFKLP